MDTPIHIETARLSIVPFGEEHLTPRYVSWLNDPEVVKFSEQRHHNHSMESCSAYYQSMADSNNLFLAICDRRTGEHIGNVSICIDAENDIADISIMIGERSFWGKRLGAEAFCGTVEFLMDQLGIRKITAGTMAVNKPMIKAMEQAGMIEDGRRINHYLFNGAPVDIIYFARWRNNG